MILTVLIKTTQRRILSPVKNKNERMIIKILIFSVFVNCDRPLRKRRQVPTCVRDDLPLQPFSTWSCSGSPEKCSMNCNNGFHRSDHRKGNQDGFKPPPTWSFQLENVRRTLQKEIGEIEWLANSIKKEWHHGNQKKFRFVSQSSQQTARPFQVTKN